MSYPPFNERIVEPAKLGGFGKDFAQEQDGLRGRVFASMCPPDISPGTRIVAVCGPNDYMDNASPDNDGWIFSDFYLFHHLFRDTSPNQVWLTCVDPETMVKKYGEYAHGSPNRERRVVLDDSMLFKLSNLRVVNTSKTSTKDMLLDRFVATVRDECVEAIRKDQNVLVLIFAHGRKRTSAISLGGNKLGIESPKLQREYFAGQIPRNAKVTLLTTSCYGGGWAQTPNLNTTTMAAVDESNESLSWPPSDSSLRHCGSRYATGVTQALIKMSFPEWQLDEGTYSRIESDNSTSATYVQLAKTIRHTLFEEVDKRESNTISFSARDDHWAMEWRVRTGISTLSDYEGKWKELRFLEPTSAASGVSQVGSVQLAEDRPPYRYQQALQIVKRKALVYLASNPGPDESAKNIHLHGSIRKLMKGQNPPPEALMVISRSLDYRQWQIMAQANLLRDELGLSCPDCEEVDPQGPMQPGMFNRVCGYFLFSEPAEDEGWEYAKGERYLTVAITRAGWAAEKAEHELSRVKQVVGEYPKPSGYLSTTYC